jgi:hypothetical protein
MPPLVGQTVKVSKTFGVLKTFPFHFGIAAMLACTGRQLSVFRVRAAYCAGQWV